MVVVAAVVDGLEYMSVVSLSVFVVVAAEVDGIDVEKIVVGPTSDVVT